MIKDDGSFELEFIDDSAPEVFLPIVTLIRGRFSNAAARHFAALMRNSSADQVEVSLRRAVLIRQRIAGPKAKEIVVTMSDFKK
ncbi:hypothetical protein U1763_17340 [Sphingomonas sp. LB2R24]|uniref:hypothetical protein n=1 Tax=Sphingomonas sorbitolis TaxID=3096165 RepID=UPI002FCB89D1